MLYSVIEARGNWKKMREVLGEALGIAKMPCASRTSLSSFNSQVLVYKCNSIKPFYKIQYNYYDFKASFQIYLLQ